jgi:hypothetical protein
VIGSGTTGERESGDSDIIKKQQKYNKMIGRKTVIMKEERSERIETRARILEKMARERRKYLTRERRKYSRIQRSQKHIGGIGK